MARTRNPLPRLMLHAFLIVLCFIMIFPVLWWFGASLKTMSELSLPTLFPEKAMWSNYSDGWKALSQYTFTHFYLNSFKLVITMTVLTTISSSLVAFSFARLNFPLKGFWFSMMMMTIMLPAQVTLIPQYSMFHQLDWINTYLPFIVPSALGSGIGGTFFVFLLVQFFRGLPRELDESAKIDGCSWWGIYFRIVLPLASPALVTVMIFSFLWGWEDYFGPLIYINSVELYTVPLALGMFVDTQSAMAWGQLLAMSLTSILPVFLLFFFAQRYFVEGIATTGLKG
ncbi:carbohydrate ABC transporter permease [Paenibacillus sp. S3N08]|uniref:Carbohydrate ABC transporter permease n=2 Tax=Paenibacillus agricola TaxID=2716264 RepID=A0ABX0JEE7_9BACL|nr:carbohydrate ABC transporter permease [Paenibacillus agricola]NHN34910.1 carbohydrate ABC transporter permease [Paenibacillus agricola]